DRAVFTEVKDLSDKNIVAIAAKGAHTLALGKNGKVYATGYNEYGGLGLGDKGEETNRPAFIEVKDLADKNISAIAAGKEHSLALSKDGKVYAAGWNDRGQLGLGDKSDREAFTEAKDLSDKNITAIFVGAYNSFAFSKDGRIYASGSNIVGGLGLSDQKDFVSFTETTYLSDRNITAIAASFPHSLALSKEGKVYAVGYGKNGQLGLGDSVSRAAYEEVVSLNDKNIIAVAAGNEHSLALTKEGKIYATGSGRYGQLGLGDSARQTELKVFAEVTSLDDKSAIAATDKQDRPATPAAVQSLGGGAKRIVQAVAASGEYSLAIIDGKVYATGGNFNGQLGLGDDDSRDAYEEIVSLSDKNITAVSAKPSRSFAISGDGRVYATGLNSAGDLDLDDEKNRDNFTEISSLKDKNITAVAAGEGIALAIAKEGKVYWARHDSASFTEVEDLRDKNIVALATSYERSLALTKEGKVYAAGYDSASFTEVTDLNGTKITAIANGSYHVLFLASDGKVYAAGENKYGQLGLGDKTDRDAFTEIASLNGKNIVHISACGIHSLALSKEGKVYAAGYNEDGRLGLGDDDNRDTFTEVTSLSGKNIATIEASDQSSFAIAKDGGLYATGNNYYGKLGLGDENMRYVFTLVPISLVSPPVEYMNKSVNNGGTNNLRLAAQNEIDKNYKRVLSVGAGFFRSFAITADGKVYATGANYLGELGLGDNAFDRSFTEIVSLNDKNITAVSTGREHSLALSKEGKVYAAGNSANGELGFNDKNARDIFTEVVNLNDNIIAISAGEAYSLALSKEGKVYATGSNSRGQLGVGNSGDEIKLRTFTEISSLEGKYIIAISAGKAHSLALDKESKVYAAGSSKYGQLGLDDKSNRNRFTEVKGLSDKNIIAIAAGDAHSIALGKDGKVYAAGDNKYGQLGVGDKTDRDSFTEAESLNGKNIIAIAAGAYRSLALSSDGKIYAAGSNKSGELGLGDRKRRVSFTEVFSLGGENIIAIAAGSDHSLALSKDGRIYAAGYNFSGELGLNDKNDRLIFTLVPIGGKK
ncbi:MAG: hypothetical protein LBC09_02495, partial [Helicobacteraceae bacterium]|nr:hypothetical protein [Helicobacteraceae bacterium]